MNSKRTIVDNRDSILCGFCWLASITTVIVFIVLILQSTISNTALRTQFAGNASMIFANWNDSITTSVNTLEVVGSLFGAVGDANNRTLGTFLDMWRDQPQNVTIAWARVVHKRNIDNFTQSVREEGFPNFSIFGESNTSDSDVMPVLYYYPPVPNATLIGFNLLSQPDRRQTIETSNRTRSISATSKIAALATTGALIVLYKPVFFANCSEFKGVVYQNFLVSRFIYDALEGVDTKAFGVVWRDLTPDDPSQAIVYVSPTVNLARVPASDDANTFVFRKRVDFAQRRWQFDIVYVLSTDWRLNANTSAVLSALVVIGCVVSVVTVLFIKNRIKLKKQEGATQLLRMVVPDHVSRQLAPHVKTMKGGDIVLEGDTLIAQNHPQVALCFIDICNFTILSSTMTAQGLVCFLDEFFTLIDNELQKHKNLVKIKTIGDSYFAVAGLQNAPAELHTSNSNHSNSSNDNEVELDGQSKANLMALVEFCFTVQKLLREHRFKVLAKYRRESPLLAKRSLATSPETHDVERARCQHVLREMFVSSDGGTTSAADAAADVDAEFLVKTRIGIHSGDVVAGVVGKKQPQYDVWGEVCNIAARVESAARNGTIQVSATVRDLILSTLAASQYRFKRRRVSLKGFGREIVYELSLVKHDAKEKLTEEMLSIEDEQQL